MSFNSLFGYTFALRSNKNRFGLAICYETDVFDSKSDKMSDILTGLANRQRESKTNNENSVIIVNLRTESNRNRKGIIFKKMEFQQASKSEFSDGHGLANGYIKKLLEFGGLGRGFGNVRPPNSNVR